MRWQELFMQTVRTPAEAADHVLQTELEFSDLWMGVIAISALSACVTGLTIVLIPLPPGWPELFASPFAHFATTAVGMILFATLLTWAGRGLGGTGTLPSLLKLILWLQTFRVGLQVLGLLLLVAVPVLGAFYGLATGLLALWVLLHFIKVGHGLASIGTASLVLFATFVGLIVGMSMLLSLVGFGSLGVTAGV
ncbi:MAG: YIP1 family protein [Paracoccaceae bacterium]